MPKWKYYFDFGLFPVVGVVLASLTWTGPSYLLGILSGTLLFTLIEYWTHRSILHRWFWHGYHERHHTHPAEFVPLPLWYTPLIFTGFGLVFPYSVTVGLMLGYMWFFGLHHLLHHVSHRKHPWLGAYAKWHMRHHDECPCNYGITHPLWDMVFGTYRR